MIEPLAYSLNACNACVSGTTLKLRPLFKPLLPCHSFSLTMVGLTFSSHFLKQRFRSLGTPSSTTVETGTKGRSSMPAARMAYSCAKLSALAKEGKEVPAWDPTMM